MHRLDPVCVSIREQMLSLDLSREARAVLDTQMREREEVLRPIYHQVAVMFADLHDTAGRMQEKGCINVSMAYFLFI